MAALFNDFASFKALCPITHDSVISNMLTTLDIKGEKRLAKAQQNLSMITQATFELSKEIGFSSMSMRDLHRKTGISLGGLYHYFESKEALALMITDTLNHIAFDWLEDMSDEQLAPATQVECLIRGHIYLSELMRPWFYFVFMESKNLPSLNKQRAQQVELNFQNKLEDLLEGNALLASHAMALIQDWHVKHWKYRHTDIDNFASSVCGLLIKPFHQGD